MEMNGENFLKKAQVTMIILAFGQIYLGAPFKYCDRKHKSQNPPKHVKIMRNVPWKHPASSCQYHNKTFLGPMSCSKDTRDGTSNLREMVALRITSSSAAHQTSLPARLFHKHSTAHFVPTLVPLCCRFPGLWHCYQSFQIPRRKSQCARKLIFLAMFD